MLHHPEHSLPDELKRESCLILERVIHIFPFATLVVKCYFLFCTTDNLDEVEQFLVTCELSRHMQELIGSYIMMEEYFMREMVVKVTLYSISINYRTMQ